MKKNTMDVVFLLDRSGSMEGSEKDTIGGYNSYLRREKEKNIQVTTILFDDEYEMIEKQTPIKEVPTLSDKKYYVRGCTALLDAIGKTIHFMDKHSQNKVLFMITTDGLENASHEFSKEQIKELIQGHKEWEFVYIGADIDSYKEGRSIGISDKNIANYEKSSKGIHRLFNALSKASNSYMEEESLDIR